MWVENRHRDRETQDNKAATLRKVEGLLDANAISRAAAAVWGASGGA